MDQSKRAFLRQCAGLAFSALGSALLPAYASADNKQVVKTLPELTAFGTSSIPSVVLAHVAKTNALSASVDRLRLNIYHDLHTMKRNLSQHNWNLAMARPDIGASLYNRDAGVRLLNIMCRGSLYLVSRDDSITGIEDLKGQKIAIPYKDDVPDLMLQHIAKAKGLKLGRDYQLDYLESYDTCVDQLFTGRARHALLTEPTIAAVELRARRAHIPMWRVINLQMEWAEVTGQSALIPQAGLLISESLLEVLPQLPQQLNSALERSTQWALTNPIQAGMLGSKHLPYESKVIEESLFGANLTLISAKDLQSELEDFFAFLERSKPGMIGDKLPSDQFYLG